MYAENIIASSRANDQVRRELLWTLPMEAINAAAVIAAINAVAAAPDLVA